MSDDMDVGYKMKLFKQEDFKELYNSMDSLPAADIANAKIATLMVEVDKIRSLMKWYTENCELVAYEPVGGDGGPSRHLPYPMEWTQAQETLKKFDEFIKEIS